MLKEMSDKDHKPENQNRERKSKKLYSVFPYVSHAALTPPYFLENSQCFLNVMKFSKKNCGFLQKILTSISAEQEKPKAYIPKDHRTEPVSGGNPNMERLKAMQKLTMHSATNARKKSPNSSNDQSPMEESGPQPELQKTII